MTGTEALCQLPHRRPRQAATGLLICDQHLVDTGELLTDVRDLWIELPTSNLPLAQPGGGNPEVRPSERPHNTEPVNLTGLALVLPSTKPMGSVTASPYRNGTRNESNGAEVPRVAKVLSAWCATISEGRNTEVDASSVPIMIASLRRHLPWIAGQTWVPGLVADLRACRASLAAATNQPSRRRPICRCPECGGEVWTNQDRLVNELLAQHKPLPDDLPGRLDVARCDDCGKVWDGWPAMTILGKMVEQVEAEGRTA